MALAPGSSVRARGEWHDGPMASTSTAVMIGRDTELAELTDAFAATAETGPHITVVGGEAGIGKSRLLIAEGLSNGQIAERLYISRKSVSMHVSAILRKLGAASRTEAVRLAALASNAAG